MKHHRQVGTESGIALSEAAEQIRMLITDLSRTVQNLDADIEAKEMRPRVDDPVFRVLDTRRHNLMVTIASLEDRLGSLEKMRSREQPTPITQPWLSGRR